MTEKKEEVESLPGFIGPNKEMIGCRNCGVVFVDYIYRKRKFCSRKCSNHFNFDFGSKAQSRKAKSSRKFNLEDLRNYLDGLLLGDGCVFEQENKFENSYRYTQTFGKNHLDGAESIQNRLDKRGISATLTPIEYFDKRTEKVYETLSLQTKFYDTFGKFRERWYKNGQKEVPKDLDFCSELLTNWYLGCGCLRKFSENNYTVKFGTDCFSKDDIGYLISQFEQMGIESRGDANSRLYIYKTDEVRKFLEKLNQLPNSFSHKWGVI